MILLDSHAFYWWAVDDPKLSRPAHEAIAQEEQVYVSAVVPWEITNKVSIGKWSAAGALAQRFFEVMDRYGFIPLPITLAHAHVAGLLPGIHRDPFDRMLAAQSQIENMPLVTADPVFRAFGTNVLW